MPRVTWREAHFRIYNIERLKEEIRIVKQKRANCDKKIEALETILLEKTSTKE